MPLSSNTWAIILAGGEGKRLRSVSIDRHGSHAPKQFCDFGHGRTLLQMALDRASRVVPASRILPVVMEHHRGWWTAELAEVPRENLLVQAANRGTAIAVLAACQRLLASGGNPFLVVLPSDHAVEDEARLGAALHRALAWAHAHPAYAALLGVRPEYAEPHYGWILPKGRTEGGVRAVDRFIEKPSLALARDLMRQGALWNSLLFAVSAATLLELYRRAEAHLSRRHALTVHDPSRTHPDKACDLSHDILAHVPDRLRVLELPACGWVDLGIPERLAAWLAHRSPGAEELVPA